MEIILKYRRKQLLILFLIFLLCSTIIYVVEYRNEKKVLSNSLNQELNTYSDLIDKFIHWNQLKDGSYTNKLDSFVSIIAGKYIRITLIDPSGKVFYDNRIKNISGMENHLSRPEVIMAQKSVKGFDVRISATDNVKYYYYARKYESYYIRSSIEYNIATLHLIEPRKFPIIFILLIFFVSTVILFFVADKFGKSVSLLKQFTLQAINDQTIDDLITFPKNELGNIGKDLVDIYEKLNKAKIDLLSEKEKLIRHLNMLDEGVAIFSKERTIVANNSNFIQFIGHISDNMILSPEDFFKIESFAPIFKFIDSQTSENQVPAKQSFYEVNNNFDAVVRKHNCPC